MKSPDKLSARRVARELSLQTLFQYEFASSVPLSQIVALYESSQDEDSLQTIETSTLEYAHQLVDGVLKNKSEIDVKIQSFSRHWKIDRMPTVDRNILRLAVYEMFFAPEPLTPNIAINEAVEVAKKFSTLDSAGFVNGVLDPMVQESSQARKK